MGSRRLNARDGLLLVVDAQERLLPTIHGGRAVLGAISRLVRGALLLGVPIVATEQYPRGLGPTVGPLAELIPGRHEKLTFHALGAAGLVDHLAERPARHVAVAGFEAHICVGQTAHDLIVAGYEVHLVEEAVSSRSESNARIGFAKMRRSGVVPASVESALYELLGRAGTPAFREILKLIK